MEKETAQSVEIAKREFDFCTEALSLLNKKPRVSRNVLQAYHREIMTIAKSFKQLFLDIAREKEGYEKALLELESDLQTEKTAKEQEYMDISLRIEELKKAIKLGISDTNHLRESNTQLEERIEDNTKRLAAMQGIYDERIAALSTLHAQLELVHAEITGLKEEKEKLEVTRAERKAELSAEENGIANCAESLEASYAKRHEELTASVETNRSNFNATREEYNRRNEAADSDLRAIQQSIERAEKEWNEAVAQKDETLSREKALREALEQEKAVLEATHAQAQQAVKEAQESAAQLEQQSRQKAECDAYYDQKVEAATEEKKQIYDRVVAAEVERAGVEGEQARLANAAARTEKECAREEEKVAAAQARIAQAEQEYRTGEEVLTTGASEVLNMAQTIARLEKEAEELKATKEGKNRTMTTELEELNEHCEDLEDKVGEEGKGRAEEKARVNSALQVAEAEHASVAAVNAKLQTEYQNGVDAKNNTKESRLARIAALQQELQACQHTLQESDRIEELFASRQARLQALQEKVNRSEKARRVLSDKIQTIRGNVIAALRVIETDPAGRFVLDVTPDERSVAVTGSGFRSPSFGYERVLWGNCGMEEIDGVLGDTLYSVLDGKTITVLSVGTQEVAAAKRQFLIQNSPNCLFYHVITSLLNQTSRLASLAQHYRFFVSAVEIDAHAAGRHVRVNYQDVSVGESYIDDEPLIHDLFEIGRFSSEFNTDAVVKVKRREVRKEEDLSDILSILCHQRASMLADPMKSSVQYTLIVTITVEGGEENGPITAGQIHLCDIAPCDCGLSSQASLSLYQENLMGLIPALDRLFCTTSSQSCDTVASDISSLSGLLSRLSNRGKIVVLNNVAAVMKDCEETLDVMSFVQCIGNCKLGPAQSRNL
ncbi:hypothetical protein AV274_6494 [Blastocystis sp. ATCC 50177/Nand II]|uniref:Uncharacterized protein n=1 Tax=Blastocystis sp. subtype 1 (strain ATCC 50177 / NandII) TaxID=478820 RepID=A0A196S647_BLAHN|nr:hypothetical protein AV274_6494 [Blastocystis sp. ATCC 50177/Nand II]